VTFLETGHDTSRLEMVVLMTPDMANFSGKVHGGALLNLLDRVAFSCASRFSQEYAVTLSGRSGRLPPADPCRRTRHLSRLDQLCRPHINGGRHPG
jgi:acyl-coenzyme A thioesterase PaaI-like protein